MWLVVKNIRTSAFEDLTPPSNQGWGAALEGGISTGGSWTKEEKENFHINELELLAAELAIKTFLKDQKIELIHLHMDNMTALYYLIYKRM